MQRRSILEVTAPALLTAFILAIALHGVGAVFGSRYSGNESLLTIVAWEVPRALVAGWAGWLVRARSAGGLLRAGLGGVLVFFVEHPIATSLVFLVMALVGDSSDTLMAIGGVMVSFVMFSPIAFVYGVAGGILAGLLGKRHAPDT
jgi:hypothetical protein